MNILQELKTAFYGGFASSDLTIGAIFICLAITVVISLYIFAVYRIINRNTFYNKNFNISLIAIAVIIAAIILTIQTNIVISLGMVGALSIVRFRTAIKDPLDLVFLFWSISVGIICGAGFAGIAFLASVIITIVIVAMNNAPVAKAPMIIVVNSSDHGNQQVILDVVKKYCDLYKVKSRNVRKGHLEMAIEIRTVKEVELIDELVQMDSITSASLVAHDGEVTF